MICLRHLASTCFSGFELISVERNYAEDRSCWQEAEVEVWRVLGGQSQQDRMQACSLEVHWLTQWGVGWNPLSCIQGQQCDDMGARRTEWPEEKGRSATMKGKLAINSNLAVALRNWWGGRVGGSRELGVEHLFEGIRGTVHVLQMKPDWGGKKKNNNNYKKKCHPIRCCILTTLAVLSYCGIIKRDIHV